MQTILRLVSIVIGPRAGNTRINGSVFVRWRMWSPNRPDRKSSSQRLGRDTEHSSACIAEAKNVCSYKSTFPCVFASCTERTLHLYLYKQNITHILRGKISNISVFWHLSIHKANCKLNYVCYNLDVINFSDFILNISLCGECFLSFKQIFALSYHSMKNIVTARLYNCKRNVAQLEVKLSLCTSWRSRREWSDCSIHL
jgi:hypothetical protein